MFLTYGPVPVGSENVPALWAYVMGDNAWYRVALDPPPGVEPRIAAGQNRALVYDPQRRPGPARPRDRRRSGQDQDLCTLAPKHSGEVCPGRATPDDSAGPSDAWPRLMTLLRGARRCTPICSWLFSHSSALSSQRPGQPPAPTLAPPLRTVDLNVGESQEVELAGGKKVAVKLLDLKETRDELRDAVRRAEVDRRGRRPEGDAGLGQLPPAGRRSAGCRSTARSRRATARTRQGRRRRQPLGPRQGRPPAALAGRLAAAEPGHVPATRPSSAGSPAARRWPTSRSTSTAARTRWSSKIYYHYGLDIGGAEGLVEVVAATDGLVVSVRQGGPAGLRRHAGQAALRRRLPARRPRLVLPLQPPAHDRPGDQARRDGQDGPADRPARQGRRQRRLVAPALRHHRPAAVGQVGHHRGLRLPLGGVPARAQAEAAGRRPAAPPRRRRREGRRSTAAARGPRTARSPRYEWTFTDGTTATRRHGRAHLRASRASTARS